MTAPNREAELQQRGGLTPPEREVMWALLCFGYPVSRDELRFKLGLKASSRTRHGALDFLIRRLVNAGYVFVEEGQRGRLATTISKTSFIQGEAARFAERYAGDAGALVVALQVVRDAATAASEGDARSRENLAESS